MPFAVVVLVVAAWAVTSPEPAIDMWISLASGRHIAAHGFSDEDPFSFASRPPARAALSADATAWQRLRAWAMPTGWINQAWAGHLVLYNVYLLGGLDGLLLFKWFAYIVVGAIVAAHARLRGARPGLAAAAAVLVLVAYRPFAQVRPQLFSDLFAATFLLALTRAQRHDRRWLLAVPVLVAAWSNFHGGFIFALLMLAVAAVVPLAEAALGSAGGASARRDAVAICLTLAAALAGAVVASPFRVANLLQPLAIAFGAEAVEWRKVSEWQPLFAGGTSADGVTWIVTAALAVLAALAAHRARRAPGQGAPPVDATAALMLAVTLLMALQSLRFLPLACLVTAPLVAAWVEVARADRPPAPTRRLARLLTAASPWAGACLAAGWFTLSFGAWARRPWPEDDRRARLADRLLQTYDRPHEACSFLTANGWHGRMFNLWEEGGFLSWCQHPDAATDRPPLQVMIDGRAQVAYDAARSREYGILMDGGPAGAAALAAGGELTPALGQEGMRWLERHLRERGVAIAHLPEQWAGTFPVQALAALPSWRAVWADERHTILVDTQTVAGRTWAAAAASGALVYPEPAAALLAQAINGARTRSGDGGLRAVELARQAYAARASARAVAVAAQAVRSEPAAAVAETFCDEVAAEFLAMRSRWAAADGYAPRLAAARTALELLVRRAEARRDLTALRRAGEGLSVVAAEEARAAAASVW
jgi:hypothetical protein